MTNDAIKSVVIIGHGYVGKAYEAFFKDTFPTIWYDPMQKGSCDKKRANKADLAVICVPTPMKENGSCDTSIVEEVLSWLNTPYVLIKSAVKPGTVDRLNAWRPDQLIQTAGHICVSPEYIGEGKYFIPFWKYPHPTDAKMHDFLVIGGPEPARSVIADAIMRVTGPSTRLFKMKSIEAEIVKYMENSWGATKVTFVNEFYEICQAFGADYQQVREGFLADGRVERMHTMVIPGKRGFGGKCFPKDVNGIVHAAISAGYFPALMKEVLKSNQRFTEKNEPTQ